MYIQLRDYLAECSLHWADNIVLLVWMIRLSQLQGGYMRNSKPHWIFAAAIAAASVFFYACPTEEEQPPPEPDALTQANAALNAGIVALNSVTSDGGTFSENGVKFNLTIGMPQVLPEYTSVEITSFELNSEKFTPTTKAVDITKSTCTITLPFDNFIEAGSGSGNLSSIKFNYRGKSTLGNGTNSAESPTPFTLNPAAISGTLNALRSVAMHFLPSGTIISGEGGTVDTLNAAGAGTLYAGDSLGGSIVIPVAASGDMLEVVGSLASNGTISSTSRTTVAALHGGSITQGSDSFVTTAGSLLIYGLEGYNQGTLAVVFAGSLSEEGGGSGLATAYFGATTKTEASNLVLTAGGIKYIVPQFGVLVTVYR
jgi:hypothetical protein